MRGVGVRLAWIVAVVAASLALPAGALGAAWLPAVALNSSTGSNPAVAVDGVGNTLAAWQTNPSTGAAVVQAARHLFGASGFTQLPDIANDQGPPPMDNVSPVVVTNSTGHGLAVWVHNTGSMGNTQVEVSTISPVGVVGPGTPVSSTEVGYANPVAAINENGDAIVAWVQNGTTVDAVTRTGLSDSFTTQATLDTNAGGAASVAIDPAGHVLAIWPSSTNNGLAYKRTSAGGTWPASDEEVFTGGHSYHDLSLADNASGQLVLAFQDTTIGTVISEADGTVSSGFGVTPPINQLSNGGTFKGPSATIDDSGGAVVGWANGGSVNFSRRPAGGAFPGPTGVQSITPVPVAPASFTLAGNGQGEVVAAWYSFETDVVHNAVRAAVLRPGTSNFESSKVISSTTVDSGNPVVTLDKGGDAVVGMQLGLTPAGVAVAVYDGAGPRLGKPAGPGTVKSGATASYSVLAQDAFSPVASISWSFGDGSAGASGTHVSHRFRAPGRFTLKVTATDKAGNSSTTSLTVTVTAPKKRCVVPRLVGKTLAQARTALRKAHCKLGKVTKPRKHGHHKLVVKRSRPRAGSVRPVGTKVALALVVKRK
jgi:hypothetical protein